MGSLDMLRVFVACSLWKIWPFREVLEAITYVRVKHI